MKTIKIISLLFCIFCGSMVFAQVKDKEKKSIRIPAQPSKKDKDSTLVKIKVAPILKKEDDKSSGDTKDAEKKFVIKESEKPFSMIDDDGLKSPSEIYERRWKKEAAQSGIIRTMSDQFLGEYKIDAEFVNIICRDFGIEDGDRVSITLNGEIIYKSLTLRNRYERVKIDLADGKNILEIKALNEGQLATNTGEFLIYDDAEDLVSSKEWRLLKGVKATVIFYNQKIVIQPKSAENDKKTETASNN